MAKAAGFKDNQLILSANKAVKNISGQDCLELMGVTHLINQKQERLMTATELGKELGVSSRAANKKLIAGGIIEPKRDGKNKLYYMPTKKGMKYCVLLDTGRSHGSGVPVQQLKYYESVKEVFEN